MKCTLFVLLSAQVVVGSCGGTTDGEIALPDQVSLPLLVRAEIDGRSELRMQGSFIWWHHYEFEAPGMWGDDQPTFLNGGQWYPLWPQDENAFCDCDSSKADLLNPPLKSDGTEISIEVISARGTVTIVQQPTAANDFTASVEFSDPLPDRDWFEVSISQN